MEQIVIYQSAKFTLAAIVSTYAQLYSNGEVKIFDVDKRHKTIRETASNASALDETARAKLRVGEKVLISGLTMQERSARR